MDSPTDLYDTNELRIARQRATLLTHMLLMAYRSGRVSSEEWDRVVTDIASRVLDTASIPAADIDAASLAAATEMLASKRSRKAAKQIRQAVVDDEALAVHFAYAMRGMTDLATSLLQALSVETRQSPASILQSISDRAWLEGRAG